MMLDARNLILQYSFKEFGGFQYNNGIVAQFNAFITFKMIDDILTR